MWAVYFYMAYTTSRHCVHLKLSQMTLIVSCLYWCFYLQGMCLLSYGASQATYRLPPMQRSEGSTHRDLLENALVTLCRMEPPAPLMCLSQLPAIPLEVFHIQCIRRVSLLMIVDTISNCQRPVFSLGVSEHKHKITNLWKFELNRSSKLRDKNEIKNTPVTRNCVLSYAWF